MSARVLILAGRGRYEDPWHDHAATSHEVAGILGATGALGRGDAVVHVRSTWRDALEDLDDVDLLVLNSGRGRTDPEFDGDDDAWAGFHSRLSRWARSGGAILALHQAANTFADAPGFDEILGGRWIPGTSMHPPIGDAEFAVVPGHPITDGLGGAGGDGAGRASDGGGMDGLADSGAGRADGGGDGDGAGWTDGGGVDGRDRGGRIHAFDERYCHLAVARGSRVLITTRGPQDPGFEAPDGDRVHPVAWANESHGGRTVYSGLGHDARSYASATHRTFLRQATTWLLSTP